MTFIRRKNGKRCIPLLSQNQNFLGFIITVKFRFKILKDFFEFVTTFFVSIILYLLKSPAHLLLLKFQEYFWVRFGLLQLLSKLFAIFFLILTKSTSFLAGWNFEKNQKIQSKNSARLTASWRMLILEFIN